jgi:amidohydrolase
MKAAAEADVNATRNVLVSVSHELWEHPELAFEEEHAAKVCIGALSDAGFSIRTGVAGMETAFIAEYGSGPLTVGICSEMDALPGIGHACGHNIIAASGVGAGIGLARIADEAGITIRVLGTPAEEGGGGKIIMLEAGEFDGLHVAMMIHPAPMESDVFPTLAATECEYHMHGKAAHSSMAPHEGINAADAITVAQVGVGLIRQHLHPGDQIHGIVTDGGDAPNIVPSHSTARYIVRASGVADLERLQGQVHRCFEAGALATGATLEIEDHGPPYTEFNHDDEIALLYKANAEALGRRFSPRLTKGAASTDMANVSLLMPTIHPSIGLDCAPAVNHQPEFTQHCKTEDADDSMIHGAIAMAQTCIDVATTDTVRDRLLGNDTTYGGRGSDYPWRF